MEGGKTVASLGEFGLIEQVFAPLQRAEVDGVAIGIGDDAAVLAVPRTQQLVVTVDTLAEGIHFNSDTDPYLLGQKTLRVNLSDLAAMGALPQWALLALSVPSSTSLSWVEEFARGMAEDGEKFGVALVGGDTTASKGCITMTVTLMGTVGQDRALRRSAAQVDDLIYVSGSIGDSALGLALRTGKIKASNSDDFSHLKTRHQKPTPRVELGLALREAAIGHGVIDVSDGLIADLERICVASGVGAEIDADKIPLSSAARHLLTAHGSDVENLILTGGEDYELLFTIPASAQEMLISTAKSCNTTITQIGRVTTKSGDVTVTREGSPLKVTRGGWSHF